MSTERAATPPLTACSVADYGDSFNPDSQEECSPTEAARDACPRIINSPMGQELTAELNCFEVDFTSAGNMRVDVRSKDHHGDLVIATALALWSAVGTPSGLVQVGKLENYW
jgi:hypothetical protein